MAYRIYIILSLLQIEVLFSIRANEIKPTIVPIIKHTKSDSQPINANISEINHSNGTINSGSHSNLEITNFNNEISNDIEMKNNSSDLMGINTNTNTNKTFINFSTNRNLNIAKALQVNDNKRANSTQLSNNANIDEEIQDYKTNKSRQDKDLDFYQISPIDYNNDDAAYDADAADGNNKDDNDVVNNFDNYTSKNDNSNVHWNITKENMTNNVGSIKSATLEPLKYSTSSPLQWNPFLAIQNISDSDYDELLKNHKMFHDYEYDEMDEDDFLKRNLNLDDMDFASSNLHYQTLQNIYSDFPDKFSFTLDDINSPNNRESSKNSLARQFLDQLLYFASAAKNKYAESANFHLYTEPYEGASSELHWTPMENRMDQRIPVLQKENIQRIPFTSDEYDSVACHCTLQKDKTFIPFSLAAEKETPYLNTREQPHSNVRQQPPSNPPQQRHSTVPQQQAFTQHIRRNDPTYQRSNKNYRSDDQQFFSDILNGHTQYSTGTQPIKQFRTLKEEHTTETNRRTRRKDDSDLPEYVKLTKSDLEYLIKSGKINSFSILETRSGDSVIKINRDNTDDQKSQSPNVPAEPRNQSYNKQRNPVANEKDNSARLYDELDNLKKTFVNNNYNYAPRFPNSQYDSSSVKQNSAPTIPKRKEPPSQQEINYSTPKNELAYLIPPIQKDLADPMKYVHDLTSYAYAQNIYTSRNPIRQINGTYYTNKNNIEPISPRQYVSDKNWSAPKFSSILSKDFIINSSGRLKEVTTDNKKTSGSVSKNLNKFSSIIPNSTITSVQKAYQINIPDLLTIDRPYGKEDDSRQSIERNDLKNSNELVIKDIRGNTFVVKPMNSTRISSDDSPISTTQVPAPKQKLTNKRKQTKKIPNQNNYQNPYWNHPQISRRPAHYRYAQHVQNPYYLNPKAKPPQRRIPQGYPQYNYASNANYRGRRY